MTQNTALTRAERLDRLPFTRRHGRLLTGSGIGWALDAMDVGLISFIVAQLGTPEVWGIDATQKSWILTTGFIGMAIGASLGGLLADRFGRRHIFAITLLVYGFATGAAAAAGLFSVTAGLIFLIAIRFVIGLGLGAELPVASTYMSEFAPARMRGRVIVLLEAFWAIGWTIAAIIGFFVVPTSHGWQWAFLIGAVPALYAAVVRFGLSESVRFLESRGKHDEAEAVVESFEKSPALFGSTPIPADAVVPAAPDSAPSENPTAGQRLSGLFSATHRTNTIGLWLVWFFVNFSYYGAFLWIPSILIANGFETTKSFGYTLIITLAQLPGYLVAAWLIEVWGRRATLSVFLVGSMVAAVLFGSAGAEWQIIAFGMLLSFFNLGAWGALYAVTPEVYPTWLRATGSGWAAGVGRIASIIAPLLVPVLLPLIGSVGLFVVFGVAFAIAAVGALLLSEKRGQALAD